MARTRTMRTAKASAATSHLICWRSIEPARRNRTAKPRARPARRTPTRIDRWSVSASSSPAAGSTPSGLEDLLEVVPAALGRAPSPSAEAAARPTAHSPTLRQPRERNRPVGNNSSIRTMRSAVSADHERAQATSSSPGRPSDTAVGGVGVQEAGHRQRDADCAEQPADGVTRVAGDDHRADRGVTDEADGVEDVEQVEPILRGPVGRRGDPADRDSAHDGRQRRGEPSQAACRHRCTSRSHSATWAGCIVSCATTRRSAATASRSSSSRRRAPKASSVRVAS